LIGRSSALCFVIGLARFIVALLVHGLVENSVDSTLDYSHPNQPISYRVSLDLQVHSRFEYGLVNHALTSATRALLKVGLSLTARVFRYQSDQHLNA
jgi:hypothetical protein